MATWVTESENNNDYFELLRSTDGLTYHVINRINGAGMSLITHVYTDYDLDAVNGTSYYKLRQYDFNGHSEEFPPVAIHTDYFESGISELKAYPNPSFGSSQIDFHSTIEIEKMLVTDILGKVIDSFILSSRKGSVHIDLSNQCSGIYFCSLISEGRIIATSKLILGEK